MTAKHIHFIMFDQLHHDYLCCTGPAHLKARHLHRFASKGMRNAGERDRSSCSSSSEPRNRLTQVHR